MPYENYIDEAIYFTSDTAIVNSFRTKFDDQWVNTADWANYANITGAADAPLRHLPEGSVAELPAVGELPHPFGQRATRPSGGRST